ncbi:hypothetical protein [Pedosphaera parvula]|uniref:Uncharacterized protein n=1 Tax=Pedosphaera parvula (strain Ellin514) TaxID=320771 RepID=B9XCE3_PEDPL|nr:hypothetical protein [Pedosphaera parvula]EEF62611.1 conserved hypothetical protein [Pedosphaera parvula Ellin514]
MNISVNDFWRAVWRNSFIFAVVMLFCPGAHAQQEIEGKPGVTKSQAVMNFSELARQQSLNKNLAKPNKKIPRHKLSPNKRVVSPATNSVDTNAVGTAEATSTGTKPGQPLAPVTPSPSPTTNFLGLVDNNTVFPPDTDGAVGPNHVATVLNSEFRIQDRNGGTVRTVTLNNFWSPLGTSPDAFDPHIFYDPYNSRWITSAGANGDTASSSLLVGVSQNSDPTGNWFLYEIQGDTTHASWADYPNLGFNKNWIVLTANMFDLITEGYVAANIYVFNKTNLYAHGAQSHKLFTDSSGLGFSIIPAVTFDASLATEYMIEDYNNTLGELRISTITGNIGSEKLTLGTSLPTTTNRWGFSVGTNFLPQLGAMRIDAGDSRILSCAFRNGSLWLAQNAFLPIAAPTRSAAQWWQVSTNGTVQQFGRIQDTGNTNYYAYPTLAVNSHNDLLIGYSRFATSQHPSAGYSVRYSTDTANTVRGDVIYKTGLATYVVYDSSDPSRINRWGDYSATCVDPLNDITMWTLQEYAASPANAWGTWWARVDVAPAPTLIYAHNRTNLVLTWTGTFTLQSATSVIGPYTNIPTATSPFTNTFASPPMRYFRLRY